MDIKRLERQIESIKKRLNPAEPELFGIYNGLTLAHSILTQKDKYEYIQAQSKPLTHSQKVSRCNAEVSKRMAK